MIYDQGCISWNVRTELGLIVHCNNFRIPIFGNNETSFWTDVLHVVIALSFVIAMSGRWKRQILTNIYKKLIKKNNRGTKRIAGLLLGYVALPLVVCALIVLIKSFLLSVISLEISKTWIFQTLVDHWLECFLIGVLNFNLLTKLIRGRG